MIGRTKKLENILTSFTRFKKLSVIFHRPVSQSIHDIEFCLKKHYAWTPLILETTLFTGQHSLFTDGSPYMLSFGTTGGVKQLGIVITEFPIA